MSDVPSLSEVTSQYERIAGVDEVGRGPLAGDVVAAAVIFGDSVPAGVTDSKKLTAKRREQLAVAIKSSARAWCVARASVAEIDSLNILQASLLAMHRAVDGLSLAPEFVLVDGNHLPRWSYEARAVIKGDLSQPAISAASIVAKVTRDSEMVILDDLYPGYGFAAHKGYPTKAHLAALASLGVSPVHRQSFGPVKRLLARPEVG